MAGIMDSVNQRTQMVGQNRLELLLFKLHGRQRYGINVFKVKEVIQCPPLTSLPHRHPVVRGVAHIRGSTIRVLDLSMAIGGRPVQDLKNSFVVIAEYNRSVQGFLVGSVERIVNLNWEDMHPPPKGAGHANYLTAVTEVDKELVEIIDVERVLSDVSPADERVSDEVLDSSSQLSKAAQTKHVLIVDDSSVARNQVKRTLEQIGCEITACKNGREAYETLLCIAEGGQHINEKLLMMISDIEMPEMDGLTFLRHARSKTQAKILVLSAVTGLGSSKAVEAKKLGADAVMNKPSGNVSMDLKEKRGDEFIETIHVLLGLAEPKPDDA